MGAQIKLRTPDLARPSNGEQTVKLLDNNTHHTPADLTSQEKVMITKELQ